MNDKDANYTFGKLLREMREHKDISSENLCLGICSGSYLTKIERGERTATKMLRDRILERLCDIPNRYETYLNASEYEPWKKRQEVVQLISLNEFDKAKHLLDEIRKKADSEDKIEMQFFADMDLIISEGKGMPAEYLLSLAKKALSYTMPCPVNEINENLFLSPKELNLCLDIIKLDNLPDSLALLDNLYSLISNDRYDPTWQAYIHPQFALVYSSSVMRNENPDVRLISKANKIIDNALDILKAAGKLFYLKELLQTKISLLTHMLLLVPNKTPLFENRIQKLTEEVSDSLDVLKYLEHLAKASFSTSNKAFIYTEYSVYSIAYVMKTRREMFGLTQTQMTEGICDIKTLRRAEKSETDLNDYYIRQLFPKIGLSQEIHKTMIESATYESKVLETEMAHKINRRQFDAAQQLLEQLKEKINASIPCNRQLLLSCEALILYQTNEIDQKSCFSLLEESLECTISKNKLRSKHGFLTGAEFSCLWNLSRYEDEPIYYPILGSIVEQVINSNKPYTYIINVPLMLMVFQEYIRRERNKRNYSVALKYCLTAIYTSICHKRAEKIPSLVMQMISIIKESTMDNIMQNIDSVPDNLYDKCRKLFLKEENAL